MPSPIDAYQSAVKQVLGGRELEAAVLQKAANRLRKCKAAWTGELSAQCREAIEMNRAIWTVFQGELMERSNPMPQSLKVNLLKLSLIVDRVTLELLASPVVEKIDLLIDVNTGIAEGLLSRPADSVQSYRGPATLCA
jgi:flagellar protein FlaF